MFLVADGWETLKRNQREVLVYLLLMALLLLLLGGAGVALGLSPENKPPWFPAYEFATELLQAAAFAALMAIVFSRLGEDIDRPQWNCPSDGEALQRFFLPWFILHLSSFVLANFAARASEAEQTGLASLLVLLWLFANLLIVPAGTCIMFHGRFRWQELGIALRPMVARLDLSLVVAGVILAQFVVMLMLLSLGVPREEVPEDDLWLLIKSQVLFMPLISVPLNLLDCLVFSMMWRVCMIYRDESIEEDDPYDF